LSQLLDAVFGRGNYIPKEEWGYRQRTATRPTRRLDQFRGVEVHHGGDRLPYEGRDRGALAAHVKSYERYHYDTRGWWALFYNVLICPNTGIVCEGRPWQYWSTSDKDAEWYLTVNIVGNTDLNGVSRETQNAIHRVWNYVQGNIRGHLERPYQTSCPGGEGMSVVLALRSVGYDQVPDEERAGILPPELINDLENGMKIIVTPQDGEQAFYCLWSDGRLEHLATMGQVEALRQAGALERELKPDQFRNLLSLQDPTTPVTPVPGAVEYKITGTAKPKG